MSNKPQQTSAQTCAGLSASVGRTVGLVEWFRVGQHEYVEAILDDLAALGVRQLRTGVSWADWNTEAGREWYDWLFPTVAARVEFLPCALYTPSSLAVIPGTAAPPRVPKHYADFIDAMITRHGQHFDWIELWAAPNNVNDRDGRIAPHRHAFSETVGGAACCAKQRGKKTVLAGMAPCGPNWLGLMCERGVMDHIDAVGIHGFPGSWEFDWTAWSERLRLVNAVLDQHGHATELWITETGYSTWTHDEQGQIEAFSAAVTAKADRIYWYSARDLDPELPTEDGLHMDVRNRMVVRTALKGVSEMFHFAAQVAVTTSLDAPVFDSEVNIGGTLTVLEELRRLSQPPGLVFTSTNKVYGGLDQLELELNGRRYEPIDALIRRRGLGETTPLCFSSPYGCSKGSADQYILDYAKNYDLPATVFRMSCIYGPRQFGNEDQGWVAHFIKTVLAGEPLVIYGDGYQVRDRLYVDDLIDAMQLAQRHIHNLAGQAYNIGGGPSNARSLLEVIHQIEGLQGKPVEIHFEVWRTADQRYYVSYTARYAQATGWRARVAVQEGVGRLYDWLAGNQSIPYAVTSGAL